VADANAATAAPGGHRRSGERPAFYDHTFLAELPRLYAEIEDELARRGSADGAHELPSFLRMGSWIGGDRTANPFVTSDALRRALRMQSARIFTWYLEQLHELGADIPARRP